MIGRKRIMGMLVPCFTGACTAVIVLSVCAMVGIILANGLPGLTWEFLTTAPTEGMTNGGIFPAIFGTVILVLLMTVVGVPVGVITAVYLSEYVAQDSVLVRVIRFSVNTLAGIPSIVFGLFGLGFFVQFVGVGMDKLLTGGVSVRWGQPNVLWASLTMAILTLPVVIVSVEEAIRTVPRELREASLALGATRWETILKVVLPNSITGILTGAILAISRGAGEVAPILFTGAAYFLPHLPGSLTDQFMHLGYHVYIMSTQSPDVDATKGIQYSTTLVLLMLTFTLNFSAVILRSHLRRSLVRT
jgi:phosphate transport system permease protein